MKKIYIYPACKKPIYIFCNGQGTVLTSHQLLKIDYFETPREKVSIKMVNQPLTNKDSPTL